MKLLLTTDAAGGVWDHSLALTRGLLAQGHDVTLAVLGAAPMDRMGEAPAAARVEALDVPLEWMPGGTECAERAGRWIDELARRVHADVVHLNQLSYACAVSAPTLVAVHGDVWSWYAEVRGHAPDERRWNDYRAAVARGLRAADLVVAPSRYQAELTAGHYGRRVDRVVWNGAAPPPPAVARSAPARAPQADGPRAARPLTLVTAGRAWDDAKGAVVLDRALGRLAGAWQGYLAGETEGPEGQASRPTHLRALGPLPKAQLWKLLGRAHAYVSPSLYEPFGLAPVEAALVGCALVLSDIGSFREIWREDALFFPRGDAEALAERLAWLRSDPARIDALGLRAARRASSLFSVARMVGEYVDLYQALAGRSDRAASLASDAQEVSCG